MNISILARNSPLSKAQVEEVFYALRSFYPALVFDSCFLSTMGDRDKLTSLRTLGKTDFFTRDIDDIQRERRGFLAIHSAKDVSDPVPTHLYLAALTRGVDSSDALLLREGESLKTLPSYATIATSSLSRENRVRALRADLTFVDIRGTIEERVEQLQKGRVDGVVMAEAALIRLRLTQLPRMRLPGATAEGQGQLALVVRKDDIELQQLVAPLDCRRFVSVAGLCRSKNA